MLKTQIAGTGQGGGKIAVAFESGSILAINSTDSDVLPSLPSEQKIYFATGGAGQNAATGKQLFENNFEVTSEKILSKVRENGKPQVIFVTASLGGGTGSGTISILADILKSEYEDVPVIGLVTLPENTFLSPKSGANVVIALSELKREAALDSMIFWDNNRVMARGVSLDKMNKWAWGPIKRFMNYVGYGSSTRTLDIQDFYSLVQQSGALAFYDTNLPLAVSNPDEIIAKIKETWEDSYYPPEITKSLKVAGGFGLMLAIPEIGQNKEHLFNQLNARMSDLFPQKTVKVSGFFIDPKLPKSQFKVLTALSGLPFPEQRLAEIVEVSAEKRTSMELPDLIMNDNLIEAMETNLTVQSPQRREESNKLDSIFKQTKNPARERPLSRKKRS